MFYKNKFSILTILCLCLSLPAVAGDYINILNTTNKTIKVSCSPVNGFCRMNNLHDTTIEPLGILSVHIGRRGGGHYYSGHLLLSDSVGTCAITYKRSSGQPLTLTANSLGMKCRVSSKAIWAL